MGTRGLPDIYTLSPRACGPRALGVYIRQTTRAHVTTIYCACTYISAFILFVVTVNYIKTIKSLIHSSYAFKADASQPQAGISLAS